MATIEPPPRAFIAGSTALTPNTTRPGSPPSRADSGQVKAPPTRLARHAGVQERHVEAAVLRHRDRHRRGVLLGVADVKLTTRAGALGHLAATGLVHVGEPGPPPRRRRAPA